MYKLSCEHMFFISPGHILGVEFLGHTVSLCWTFWGTAKLFSFSYLHQWCLKVPISPHHCQPLFLKKLYGTIVGMKWYLTVVSVCIILTNNFGHVFMCLLAICVSSLEQYLCRFFFSFLKFGYLTFYCWVASVLYIFWILGFISYMTCKHFPSFWRLYYVFLDGVLWNTKVVN